MCTPIAERAADNRKSVVAQAAAQGDGSWLWSSVAAAAGSLTLNINKAWATKVAVYSGEGPPRSFPLPTDLANVCIIETPPGAESRLTRAMKAYHLEKAQRPSDLPDWLFPESERRAPRGEPDEDRDRPRSRRERDEGFDEPPAPRARGLRDIYDSAARDVAVPASAPAPRRAAAAAEGDGPAPSRAANRLKALRDAKRAAAGVRAPSPEPVAAREAEIAPAPAPVARVRVGLPTGPGRVRRPA
jgi:hypothetical protein